MDYLTFNSIIDSTYDHFDDSLDHYGVKGMKWGQHLFGKVRTGSNSRSKKKVSDDYYRSRQLMKKKTKYLSNKELQEVINRRNLENTYANLNPSALKKGKNKVASALKIGGAVTLTAVSVGRIWGVPSQSQGFSAEQVEKINRGLRTAEEVAKLLAPKKKK